MVKLATIALVLGACVGDGPVVPESVEPVGLHDAIGTVRVDGIDVAIDEPVGVCDRAAALPASDMCSLVCDPDAFTARVIDEGMPGGRCYNFRCEFLDGSSASVGTCIP